MPMDGLTLGFVAREMEEVLVGGRIDKVTPAGEGYAGAADTGGKREPAASAVRKPE